MQFDLRTMAEHMGAVAWGVVILLFIMSMYSIAVMIERYWTFRQATLQSRKYAPEVARFLKQGKIKEAIDVFGYSDPRPTGGEKPEPRARQILKLDEEEILTIGEPAPCSDHRFFGLRPLFLAMTAFAASRIVIVER